MEYICITCKETKTVNTAIQSNRRPAVCVCEECVRASITPDLESLRRPN